MLPLYYEPMLPVTTKCFQVDIRSDMELFRAL
jgi:hypothetical protein